MTVLQPSLVTSVPLDKSTEINPTKLRTVLCQRYALDLMNTSSGNIMPEYPESPAQWESFSELLRVPVPHSVAPAKAQKATKMGALQAQYSIEKFWVPFAVFFGTLPVTTSRFTCADLPPADVIAKYEKWLHKRDIDAYAAYQITANITLLLNEKCANVAYFSNFGC